jgi:hypothetical protein
MEKPDPREISPPSFRVMKIWARINLLSTIISANPFPIIRRNNRGMETIMVK